MGVIIEQRENGQAGRQEHFTGDWIARHTFRREAAGTSHDDGTQGKPI